MSTPGILTTQGRDETAGGLLRRCLLWPRIAVDSGLELAMRLLFANQKLCGGLLALLALAVGFPAAAVEKPLAGYDGLASRLAKAYDNKDYPGALAIAEEINELVTPLHTDALYDLARLNCLLGKKERAYEWLEAAIDAGFWNTRKLRDDPAFAALAREDRFRALVRGLWAQGYIAMLEREERESFQMPVLVMETLALSPGERVADVGAGSGYFTFRVAAAVGPGGKVWAIDVVQELLDFIAVRIEREGITNVELMKVPTDDPQLPAGGVDTILMVDVLHYIKEQGAYAKKLRAGLAPGGRLVIIDYRPKSRAERPWGPSPEQQIERPIVDAAMAEAGLVPVRSHDFLPEQYFVEYQVK